MEDWQTIPIILFMCGLGMLVLAFMFVDLGFGLFAFFFFASACFSALLCDTGGVK